MSQNEDEERCANCRFFKDTREVERHGQCRRYPPSIKVKPSRYHGARSGGSFHGDREPDHIGWAEFPQVHMNVSCGEWKPRP
ncbi:hypothetical protein D869_gp237 [Caulobacter phage CcrRogue]|uniref:Uncharacterized protein n=1 Tax=Caulobacter phage CcrRogue TaxID=2927986 RepID=K4K372_9CAUD|nr:hypothetical protein D869_gp237 [Caulobacter phage CcrRogue]AFU86677.1 hypothetical protein CcrRogue_gp195 [Caulobacter phage CcrRogue]